MSEWLTTFVSIERVFVIIKGVKFNQKKAVLAAKWTIFGLILVTIATNIQDPIYRSLFDEEKRIWCIVIYPSGIRIIDLVINMFDLITPFIINFISAIVIIIMSARIKLSTPTRQNYKELLEKQFHRHKNLLIGPCVLIILDIPRLIIPFASGCMKSVNDSWLFLVGYYISLIPSTLTFVLFVLPSTAYKKVFRNIINRY